MLQYIVPEYASEPVFSDGLERRVSLMKLIPGTDEAQLEFLLSRSEALVIESFGVGGLPRGMHEAVHASAREGKLIVMTTQVQNEGSDLAVYGTGRTLSEDPADTGGLRHDHRGRGDQADVAAPARESQLDAARLFYTPVNKDILTARM